MTDVDDIRHTLALYSRYNDEQDSTAWSELWTPDGSVTDRSGTYVGRPAIKRFVDGINDANPDRDTLHFCANAVIAPDGDTAQAHTDIVFVARPTRPVGDWVVRGINHYSDRLVRQGSKWLFADRRIDPRPTVRVPLDALRLAPPPDDEEAIRRTLALYAQLFDSKDPSGWSEQFATDGTLHTTHGDFSGRAAIKRVLEQRLADEPPEHDTAHLCVNALIERQTDTARVISDCLVFEKLGANPWSMVGLSRAHDRLVREAGAWRFAWKDAEATPIQLGGA